MASTAMMLMVVMAPNIASRFWNDLPISLHWLSVYTTTSTRPVIAVQ